MSPLVPYHLRRIGPGLFCLLLALAGMRVSAQFWQEVQIQTPDDVTAGGRFGAALDMTGDLLAIGAPGVDAGAPGSGAVYLFRKNAEGLSTWGFVQRILPPAPFTQGGFGSQVMFHDDALFVAAPRERIEGLTKGAMHMYVSDASGSLWEHEQLLAPHVDRSELNTGTMLAAFEDLLFTYAPGYDANLDDAIPPRGAVLVFKRHADGLFQEVRMMTGEELVPGSTTYGLLALAGGFADSLYYVGDDARAHALPLEPLYEPDQPLPTPHTVEFGSPFDVDPSLQVLNGCADEASLFLMLTGSTGPTSSYSAGVHFSDVGGVLQQQGDFVADTTNRELIWKWGASVASGAGMVVVGDPGDITFTPLGYAEVFRPDGMSATAWSRYGLLIPSEPEYGARFGYAVAAGADVAVVGAPKQGGLDEGRVFTYFDPAMGILGGLEDQALQLHPVPFSNDRHASLFVELPDVPGSLSLIAMDGRSVAERAVNGSIAWSFEALPAGTYQVYWMPSSPGYVPRSSSLIIAP